MTTPQKKSKPIKESVLNEEIQFLTLEECARFIRINYKTFAQWVKNGKGPRVRQLSRQCIRVAKKDFFDWCAAQGK